MTIILIDQVAGKLTNILLTRSHVAVANHKALEEADRATVKVDDFIANDKAVWIDVVVKVTGLDKTVAAAAIEDLDPDPKNHRASAVAIAAMMRDLKYVNSEVSAAVERNMDCRCLEAATGTPEAEPGY
jgi:hypothetical protein